MLVIKSLCFFMRPQAVFAAQYSNLLGAIDNWPTASVCRTGLHFWYNGPIFARYPQLSVTSLTISSCE